MLAGSLSVASEDIAGPVPARVIEVVDGDTVLVRARIWLGQDVETHVRLLDLDAPELKGRCAAERERARQAKAFLESWLGDGAVELRDIRFDKYGGRVLARIVRGGQDVAAAMIAAGLGRPYDGRRRAPWCADQQG